MTRKEGIVKIDRILLEMATHQREIGRADGVIQAINENKGNVDLQRYDVKAQIAKMINEKKRHQNNVENLKKRMHLIINQIETRSDRL